jgi:hypothetical protein
MATPLTAGRRAAQLALALPILWLAQAFGVVAESLKAVVIDPGALAAEAARHAELSLNAVALAYQFGYLLLPGLLPAVLWIGANRAFIAAVSGRGGAEPATIRGVEARNPRGG